MNGARRGKVDVDRFPGGEDATVSDDHVVQTTVALDGNGTCIAEARRLSAEFLVRAQVEHGLSVSQRAKDVTQLVVSELVTNARKYAPGPVLMELRIVDGSVEVVVCDSEPTLPVASAADAGRIGRHGLEIVMAVAHGFDAQPTPLGKRVTARIALANEPESTLSDVRAV
ncbi:MULTISPECIES: ATP-binding protein [unclassified Streptomyces]|uniref:ATP-binding protein n=1 Tax=unclassified Streptomyces TaxID=2593676 RepID=UPI0036E5184F